MATLAMPSETELSQLSKNDLIGVVQRAVGRLQVQGTRIKKMAASLKDEAVDIGWGALGYGTAAIAGAGVGYWMGSIQRNILDGKEGYDEESLLVMGFDKDLVAALAGALGAYVMAKRGGQTDLDAILTALLNLRRGGRDLRLGGGAWLFVRLIIDRRDGERDGRRFGGDRNEGNARRLRALKQRGAFAGIRERQAGEDAARHVVPDRGTLAGEVRQPPVVGVLARAGVEHGQRARVRGVVDPAAGQRDRARPPLVDPAVLRIERHDRLDQPGDAVRGALRPTEVAAQA